ncbi:MAG TPA: FGGY family carbohydrate kinase [Atribacteraceae bacterium]|nr:FGGY family carbohydrate kinase [Atribacteraceae bacterium]
MNIYFVVLDCGATSIRAVTIGEKGEILHISSCPNAPRPQEGIRENLIWDVDEVWDKSIRVVRDVVSKTPGKAVSLTVTAFGADGAPVKKDGSLTYPVISWQCSRTVPWTNRLIGSLSAREIFRITGYQIIPFNTLFKLLWLRENAPRSLEQADCFMMMPGILSHRFCGEFSIDWTSASTTMMLDIQNKTWSKRILSLAELDSSFFPRMVRPGEVIGTLLDKVAGETGLPGKIPVISTGHDTQFALMGSLASPDEVILNSGTWEIAALRVSECRDSDRAFELGILTEIDSEEGLWNPQMLMIAGGVVEWVRRNFFCDIKDHGEIYRMMIEGAQQVPPGSRGVVAIPSFMPSGPNKPQHTQGTLLGLELTTERVEIFRAVLEGLCYQLKQAVLAFREVFSFVPQGIRVVGGGAKNTLWNQIRADVLNLPVLTTSVEEATVLGATLFSMVGSGFTQNIDQAREMIVIDTRTFEPSNLTPVYQGFFEEYAKIPFFLAPHYRNRGEFSV